MELQLDIQREVTLKDVSWDGQMFKTKHLHTCSPNAVPRFIIRSFWCRQRSVVPLHLQSPTHSFAFLLCGSPPSRSIYLVAPVIFFSSLHQTVWLAQLTSSSRQMCSATGSTLTQVLYIPIQVWYIYHIHTVYTLLFLSVKTNAAVWFFFTNTVFMFL